jgi:hypothetical protein
MTNSQKARNSFKDEDQRESGMAGGGKGRKDEVGQSGVYPMSGPHPPGNAEIKGQASWGQGERGAAGYEEHGGSELTFDNGQLLGGLNVGPGGEPMPKEAKWARIPATGDIDIPPDDWKSFLESFSRQHENWLVTVELETNAGKPEVENRPLRGIEMEDADGNTRAVITVGEVTEGEATHVVNAPTRIIFKQTETGEHEGLKIASGDGSAIFIRFRSAAKPEMLDHMAA